MFQTEKNLTPPALPPLPSFEYPEQPLTPSSCLQPLFSPVSNHCTPPTYYQEQSSPAFTPVQSIMESVPVSSTPCPRTPLSRISTNQDDTTGLPKELPFPKCFSIQVEAAIQNDNALPVRLKAY